MEELYISTFFLDSSTARTRCEYRFGNLILKEVEVKYTEVLPFKKIQESIRMAQMDNDDVIVVVQNHDTLSGLECENLLNAVHQMTERQFYLMGISAECESRPFRIDNDLAYVSSFSRLNSFVICSAAFDFILSFTEDMIARLWPRKRHFPLEFVLNEIFIKKSLLLPNNETGTHFEVNQASINLIVPFRNIEQFLAECCDSIVAQKYSNYKVFFVDDCSEDNSVMKIPRLPNFFILKNRTRKYALHNIVHVLREFQFSPSDIIAILDGDDKLTHEYVFSLLNNIYSTERCLVTYGSFKISGSLIEPYYYTRNEFDALRSRAWKASHLKTFRYKVFTEYLNQDPRLIHMRGRDLKFYKTTYDQALMFPLLEIAGYDRVRFVKDRVYDYRIHPNNDHSVSSSLQTETEWEIRSKAKFKQRFFD